MAGISVAVKTQGDLTGLLRSARKVAEADWDKLNGQIANAVLNAALDAFKQGQSPWGEKWKPSLRAQGLVKGKKPGKTLVDTGRLRKSIHARATSEAAEVGTDVVYARIHQLGGTAGRGAKIPARPYLPVNEQGLAPDTERTIKALVEKFLEELLG
jgi:phage virion morphogenesis protein